MGDRPILGLSLCAGIGGIDLGLELALGPAYHTACFVEREPFPQRILAARWPGVPIWDDLTTFDGSAWRGVDIVCSGDPCQPHSVAGKRLGEADERDLWPHVRRVVEDARPALVFRENVPGGLRHVYERVLPDLRKLGYRTEVGLFSAEECGAPHRRLRVFVLAVGLADGDIGGRTLERIGRLREDADAQSWRDAYRCRGEAHGGVGLADTRRQRQGGSERRRGEAGGAGAADAGRDGEALADGSRDGRFEGRAESAGSTRGPDVAERGGEGVADPEGCIGQDEPGSDGRERSMVCPGAGADSRDVSRETPSGVQLSGRGPGEQPPPTLVWPPAPNDLHAWGRVQTDAQPSLCRVAHGIPKRTHRLRALGNAVVPLVAAHAFRTLAARALARMSEAA